MIVSMRGLTAAGGLLAPILLCLELSYAAPTPSADAAAAEANVVVHYHTTKIDGVDVFYREAGPSNGPVVLLLHGFPTSSHMFRRLIPALADRYHVIAPDYPGFGESAMPDRLVSLHFRSLRGPDGRSNEPSRRRALRFVSHGLRRSGWLPACA
jgi:alpha/beta hydrolase fold